MNNDGKDGWGLIVGIILAGVALLCIGYGERIAAMFGRWWL